NHPLVGVYSEKTLLIYKPAAIARLLDTRLQLHHASRSRPTQIARPVVPRRAIGDRALADRSHSSGDVPEVCRGIEVILLPICAQPDAELLFAAAKLTGAPRSDWTRRRVKEISPRLEGDGGGAMHRELRAERKSIESE